MKSFKYKGFICKPTTEYYISGNYSAAFCKGSIEDVKKFIENNLTDDALLRQSKFKLENLKRYAKDYNDSVKKLNNEIKQLELKCKHK